MPNELGLYTKQEAKAIRDINLISGSVDLKRIAELIRGVQQSGDAQTQADLNMVVHKDVAKYFKNDVGYDLIEQTVATPANHTRIVSISWLI